MKYRTYVCRTLEQSFKLLQRFQKKVSPQIIKRKTHFLPFICILFSGSVPVFEMVAMEISTVS